jgi:hypothetical protein
MGVDAGIVVTRQITDEFKWSQAMVEVHRLFRGQPYFRRESTSAGVFTTMKADLWEVQEPLNFMGEHSEHPYYWETYHRIEGEDLRRAVKTLVELRELVLSLEEAFQRVVPQNDGELASADEELRKELGRARIARLTASAARTDPFQLEASAHQLLGTAAPHYVCDSHLAPPPLFTFEAGDSPWLPVFARHFRSFESDISGDTLTL